MMDKTPTVDLIELVKEGFSDLTTPDEMTELINRLEEAHKRHHATFRVTIESEGGFFNGSVRGITSKFQGIIPTLKKPTSKSYDGTLHDFSFEGHRLSLFRDTEIFEFKAGNHLLLGFWSKDTDSGRKPLGIFISLQNVAPHEFEPYKGTDKGRWH